MMAVLAFPVSSRTYHKRQYDFAVAWTPMQHIRMDRQDCGCAAVAVLQLCDMLMGGTAQGRFPQQSALVQVATVAHHRHAMQESSRSASLQYLQIRPHSVIPQARRVLLTYVQSIRNASELSLRDKRSAHDRRSPCRLSALFERIASSASRRAIREFARAPRAIALASSSRRGS